MEREPGERCQQEGRPVVQRRSQPGEAGCLGLRGHTKPPDFCALVKLYSKSLFRKMNIRLLNSMFVLSIFVSYYFVLSVIILEI